MRIDAAAITVLAVASLAAVWYVAEPWTLTFIDDGPYFSREYSGPVADFPIHSQVELRRFGQSVFALESRLLASGDESVLVLRNADGSIAWARMPLKPKGELGPLAFRRANVTWYGGWCISIKPENQESGYLYLGSRGGFRFLNHSW